MRSWKETFSLILKVRLDVGVQPVQSVSPDAVHPLREDARLNAAGCLAGVLSNPLVLNHW